MNDDAGCVVLGDRTRGAQRRNTRGGVSTLTIGGGDLTDRILDAAATDGTVRVVIDPEDGWSGRYKVRSFGLLKDDEFVELDLVHSAFREPLPLGDRA